FFQAEDGIRDLTVTGVQTCALPIFDVDAHLFSRHRRRVIDYLHGESLYSLQTALWDKAQRAGILFTQVFFGGKKRAPKIRGDARSEERRVGKECRYRR